MLVLRRSALAIALLTFTASCGDGGSGTGGSAGATTSSATTAGTGGTGAAGAGGSSATSTGGSAQGGSAQGGSAGAGATGATGGTTSTGGGAQGGSAGTGATGATGGTTSTGGGAQGGSGGATSGSGGAMSGSGGAMSGSGGAAMDPYGDVSGCDLIGFPEIQSPDPSLFDDLLDFTGEPPFDVAYLSPGGQAMYAAGNLNQSSLYSEIFAYEVLYRCDNATFLKGEAEITYAINGKKTDLLVEIDGAKVGVSVVRAESYPKGAPYPVAQAFNVLDGKLADILQSTANVAPEDAWEKQILAVMAQTPDHAAAIAQAWTMVDPVHKADTIVVITTTEGDDDFIYYAP